MAVWAIADLHLSFGVPNKQMDVFGPQWERHAEKIEKSWKSSIAPEDLILIPGDISWAMRLDEVIPDLEWIGRLPGTKVMIKGNHDYWWSSLSKIKEILPPSCHLIQNNSWEWNDIAIAGARLWDISSLNFNHVIQMRESESAALTIKDETAESEKIFQRELGRLETSLKSMNPKAKKRIAMTHYPPIGPELQPTEASQLLEKYQVDICVFGHLHNAKKGVSLFGEYHGIQYFLVACDYLNNFQPLKIL